MTDRRANVRRCLAAAVLAVPWLTPFSFGPLASALPWAVGAYLVAVLVIAGSPMGGRDQWQETNTIVLAVAFVVLVVVRPASGTGFDLLALLGGLVLIVLSRSLMSRSNRCAAAKFLSIWPWIAAGVLSSALALLQYLGQAHAVAPWVSPAPAGEAYANLRQRNQFASLTNIALVALLALSAQRDASGEGFGARWLRSAQLVFTVAALLAFGNAASSSRTGLLQLVIIVIIGFTCYRNQRAAPYLCAVIASYVLGSVALPWMADLDPAMHGMFARLREGDAVCSSRITLWSNVLHLIAQRPWFGWGWGELDYAHFITLYDGPRFCDILDNAHNLPLHLAVELGVPVAIAFCVGIAWWVWRSKPWRETDPMRQLAWMVIMIIGIHSMVEYPLWYAPFQIALGLSLGLLVKPRAVPIAIQESKTSWWSQLTPSVALAIALFAACMYAAWDYRRISQIYLDPTARAPEFRYETLAKIQGSWLFRRQVQFAELTTSRLTPQNAERVHALALDLLHFSPEARVVEKLISSAQLLGREDEVAFYLRRYKAAFPDAYDKWMDRRSSLGKVAD